MLPNSRRTAELWRTSDSLNLSFSRKEEITSRPPVCKIQPVICSRFIFAAASEIRKIIFRDVAGDLRNLRRQNIPQHSVFVAKPQRVALGGDEPRVGEFPFDAAFVFRRRLVGQNRRARAVGEQTRADQNAGVVIEKKCRAANFDADGQNFFGASGGENGFAARKFGRAAPQPWPTRSSAKIFSRRPSCSLT
jgi:hypothetical protein